MVPTVVPISSEAISPAAVIVRESSGRPFFEAKFRYAGRQVKRRIGPAWLERPDAVGEWVPRRGRVPAGAYDARRAHVRAAGIVAEYVAGFDEAQRSAAPEWSEHPTFRDVASAYLEWLERVRGAKPATLRDHRSVLGEPGVDYARGTGTTRGHILQALGDRPADEITARDVESVLARIAATGASASTVNKYRARVSAVFAYGMRETMFRLPSNPASGADKRREPQRSSLLYYSPEELEALARQMGGQDGEIVRVAAYAGLRMGELLALRWRDVDFTGHALTISRAMSAGVESGTKSGRLRRVPLPDQAAAALDRLSRRDDFIGSGELVFVNELGRGLDGSALRRRFKRARDAAGLRPLRFHDLRHTYGSLLAAAGVDLVTIQAAMGHSQLATTSRYLHAKPASEEAAVFTRAFEPALPAVDGVPRPG